MTDSLFPLFCFWSLFQLCLSNGLWTLLNQIWPVLMICQPLNHLITSVLYSDCCCLLSDPSRSRFIYYNSVVSWSLHPNDHSIPLYFYIIQLSSMHYSQSIIFLLYLLYSIYYLIIHLIVLFINYNLNQRYRLIIIIWLFQYIIIFISIWYC